MKSLYYIAISAFSVFIKSSLKNFVLKSFQPASQVSSHKDIMLFTYFFFFAGLMNKKNQNQKGDFLYYINDILTDEVSKKSAQKIFEKGSQIDERLLVQYLLKFKKKVPHPLSHNRLFEHLYELNKNNLTFYQHLHFKTIMKTLEVDCQMYKQIYDKRFQPILDAYKLLNCSDYFTGKELKKAYRIATLNFHPDKANAKQLEEYKNKFQNIQNAYRLIQNSH